MITISGRHIRNAMVERRRMKRCRPLRRAACSPPSAADHVCCTASTMLALWIARGLTACRARGTRSLRSGSDAQRAFELAGRPLDHVVELLVALRELRHHDGVDRLVVDLRAD